MGPLADHRGIVLWGSFAAACLVAQQVTGKATRDAFFLSHYPATSLPPVMMAASLVAVVAALAVSRLLATRTPRLAVPALVGLNAALLLGQFLLARSVPHLAAFLVYLQVAATGGTLVSGYWSVVSERFDPWTAKQAMSRLALGASMGGAAGGLVAFAAAGRLPVEAMLLLTAALNVAALVALVVFGGDGPAPARGPVKRGVAPLRSLRSAPYLQLLAFLVALGAGVEALLDYVLKSRASATLASGHEMLAFFAAYHAGMSLLALAGQTLLAGPALQNLGLARTVALRPLAVVAASAVGLVDLRLWSAVLVRGSHDVFSNSLFRSAYELLYTPLPEAEKRATKQLIDVGFDKLGALAGGAAALAAVRLLAAPEHALLFGAGGLSLLAVGLTQKLHRGYVATLEEGLRAGKLRIDSAEVMDSTTLFTVAQARLPDLRAPRTPPAASDPLLKSIAELRSGDAARIRLALHGADGLDTALVPHLVPLLGRDDVHLDALRALRRLAPRATGQLLDVVLDSSADPVVRRRLPRVLKAAPGPRTTEGLLRGVDDPSFEVRASCSAALAALAHRTPALDAPAPAVFAAVRRELERTQAPPGSPSTGPPDKQAILDHVFRLLSLVLEQEPLRIAALAIRRADAGLKGTALEYLENVLPAELRAGFLRFVEAPASGRARPRAELLTDLMKSGPGAGDRRRPQALKPRD